MNNKPPIINCHTHIFTGDHVPPFLAKTFVPWPFYYLLPVSGVVKLLRFWRDKVYTWKFKGWYKNIEDRYYQARMFVARNGILRIINLLIGAYLTIQVFFVFFDWLSAVSPPGNSVQNTIDSLRQWLGRYGLLFIPKSLLGKIALVVILLAFFKSGRNFLWFVLKKIWSFFSILPGPQSKELAKRYINIGRFASYRFQNKVLGRLQNQYPAGTKFVLLPMDMEFMGAGPISKGSKFNDQMEAIAALKKRDENKNLLYPFVFVDPRRMVKEGSSYFDHSFKNGKVDLKPCFIKKYIEELQFSGFKIYPALGYYPFDEKLLPLWKYAADNGLPIMTHCIRGTIFYRGRKKKEWDKHPVFQQATTAGNYEPLALLEIKNKDFINNFTHPLNFLCLLDETLLRKVVEKAHDLSLRSLFGFTDSSTPLKYDLQHLKICCGHYGGDDEWNRFIELDRDNYSSQLVRHPEKGITFLTDEEGIETPGKPEQIWKYVDWYSIICSLMLQYPNVYADLSYILHGESIEPLLKQTLLNPVLRQKVLFGTDFYVVRNYKSEKNMLADMLFHLNEIDFDQIARANPVAYLNNTLH